MMIIAQSLTISLNKTERRSQKESGDEIVLSPSSRLLHSHIIARPYIPSHPIKEGTRRKKMKVLPARPLLAGGQCPPQRHQESYSLVAEAVGRYYPYSRDEDGVRLPFRPSDNAAGYTPKKSCLLM